MATHELNSRYLSATRGKYACALSAGKWLTVAYASTDRKSAGSLQRSSFRENPTFLTSVVR